MRDIQRDGEYSVLLSPHPQVTCLTESSCSLGWLRPSDLKLLTAGEPVGSSLPVLTALLKNSRIRGAWRASQYSPKDITCHADEETGEKSSKKSNRFGAGAGWDLSLFEAWLGPVRKLLEQEGLQAQLERKPGPRHQGIDLAQDIESAHEQRLIDEQIAAELRARKAHEAREQEASMREAAARAAGISTIKKAKATRYSSPVRPPPPQANATVVEIPTVSAEAAKQADNSTSMMSVLRSAVTLDEALLGAEPLIWTAAPPLQATAVEPSPLATMTHDEASLDEGSQVDGSKHGAIATDAAVNEAVLEEISEQQEEEEEAAASPSMPIHQLRCLKFRYKGCRPSSAANHGQEQGSKGKRFVRSLPSCGDYSRPLSDLTIAQSNRIAYPSNRNLRSTPVHMSMSAMSSLTIAEAFAPSIPVSVWPGICRTIHSFQDLTPHTSDHRYSGTHVFRRHACQASSDKRTTTTS